MLKYAGRTARKWSPPEFLVIRTLSAGISCNYFECSLHSKIRLRPWHWILLTERFKLTNNASFYGGAGGNRPPPPPPRDLGGPSNTLYPLAPCIRSRSPSGCWPFRSRRTRVAPGAGREPCSCSRTAGRASPWCSRSLPPASWICIGANVADRLCMLAAPCSARN